jgi:uncharacterized protein YbaA (DUF1428 family)
LAKAKPNETVWFSYITFKSRAHRDQVNKKVNAKPEHVVLTFSKLAKAKPNETVWFSYITYKSRQHRDQVNKKVMAEMDKKYSDQEKNQAMPFDMKRMSYGGFKVMVG